MEKIGIFGSFLYKNLAFTLQAYNQRQSKKVFKIIEKNKDKFYFLGYVKYEFYRYLEKQNYTSKEPFVYFLAFREKIRFSEKDENLDFCPIFTQDLDQKKYFTDFDKVKKAIAKGQSYQVNLTQELHFKSNLDLYNSFISLYPKQNTQFKAYIKNEFLELASFSPELFFKIKNNIISTKPMKGTIKRSKLKNEDEKFKYFLKNDEKTLSENVMIVDLLRNDLSKLIVKHTQKTELFIVKSYPTLHQLISKVSGKLKKNVNYFDIFKALFPCGSITGAPKIETIKFIKKLEQRKRGIYCGAIGLIHKEKTKFSVAIRTIEKNNNENFFKYGVGSGLVWDSNKDEEFEELKLKTKILRNEFYLFETMYYEDCYILFFKEHLQRILNSAAFFNFNTKNLKDKFKTILTQEYEKKYFTSLQNFNDFTFKNKHYFSKSNFLQKSKKALKLKLFKNGIFEFDFFDIKENSSDKLLLSDNILKINFLNFHKTSLRSIYDANAKLWKEDICYDIAFFDEQGLLCEGSRTNIIINLNDEYFTPYAKNCLNGIYRQTLLKHKLIKEKDITKDELLNAKEIYAINSLRGLKKVIL
ncbi:bifunctional anthranilate synthase component I family protein/class IV aminotransferase [Campylobacter insulaenigrae]|uniref:bifunctional chorismate-binding protein/class IV aminotransferase n=1 Tax=Campylobacter insulaenigrae TaxID=260714 RepID=UPI00215201D2|nr:bifunctional anthranilate synthase component I family protein/class IV aminotransferase [Campylobacter insulaenigrae]MCR6570304.1 bifunctional anthranilate synthase component I family protein/class IV aminotransferase [Campylobacter insulaenigrae]MCR6574808.1 bifunctional anthranilate synthase component I family protein/class IV aminotransferase [Campylobacter insulaenigrae]MCR6576500.1 bifunctional anthranilate synthase component I family protein/class IV aminotransferase [Campylobacter insu